DDPAPEAQDTPTPAAAAPAAAGPGDDPGQASVSAIAVPDDIAPRDAIEDAPALPADVVPVSRRAAGLLRHARNTGDASAPQMLTFAPPPRTPSPLPPPEAPAADRPYAPARAQEIETGWPIGPAPLGRVAMADLMNRVVAAPAIVAGLPSE